MPGADESTYKASSQGLRQMPSDGPDGLGAGSFRTEGPSLRPHAAGEQREAKDSVATSSAGQNLSNRSSTPGSPEGADRGQGAGTKAGRGHDDQPWYAVLSPLFLRPLALHTLHIGA